jgi:putative ABC transport system substrate-binding protein
MAKGASRWVDGLRRRSSENWRQGAALIANVLCGAKPAELPAELPTKFELLINLTAAKSLGIAFQSSILVRADEAIE